MLIDKEKCIRCGQCIPYCPMGCISKTDDGVAINTDECVECEICRNAKVCPRDALYMPKLEYPRTLRSQFSNPLIPHPDTGVPGRGTEEMKTNDVTGRFPRGKAGIAIELGRPGTGTRLRDVQTIAMAVAPYAKYGFEPHNPVTVLMLDGSGKLRDEVLNEKTLSAIVELEVDQTDVLPVFNALRDAQKDISTVLILPADLSRMKAVPLQLLQKKLVISSPLMEKRMLVSENPAIRRIDYVTYITSLRHRRKPKG